MSYGKRGVVFDFDGTLTRKGPSLWAAIDAHAISDECRGVMDGLRARYMGAAIDGTLSRDGELEWLLGTLNGYLADGLSEAGVRHAAGKVELRPGAVECLRFLEERAVPVAIVSYGIAQAIASVLEANAVPAEHGVFGCIYASRLTVDGGDGQGTFTGFDPATLVIPSNKGEWSARFAQRHGIDPDALLAVGDSGGDRFLCPRRENLLGIAKDDAEAEKLRGIMGGAVTTEGFGPVTAWLKERLRL
jgi:HAD superfamily phosphoserine phosphatase-like hydrolase